MKCLRPPPGWSCSRDAGHDGPCPASPVDEEFTIDVLAAERMATEAVFKGDIFATLRDLYFALVRIARENDLLRKADR